MFCPKCGQEQVSESLRFCSRCGSKLDIAAADLLKRLLGMAMYLVLTAAAIFGWGALSAGPAYMQLRFLIMLLAVVAFYLLFAPDLKRLFQIMLSKNFERMKPIQESPSPPALAPHRVNTSEMLQPPSVTEQTTTLLDRSERST
jgi:hypothetical protein